MRRLLLLLNLLLATALSAAGCVKWGPTDKWHRARSGMELYLEEHIHGYAECQGVYPGIEVDSAKLETSLLNGWVTADCRGDFSGAIWSAIGAAGIRDVHPPEGHVLKIILYSETSVRCGRKFEVSDNCVSVVHGDVAILASWWSPHESMRKAFIALRDGPPAEELTRNPGGHGFEWAGTRLSMGTVVGSFPLGGGP